jgi:2-polyprenyl-3-methyl-5-hydroxy-6-metoxy-1,4-benzoquinol methylase
MNETVCDEWALQQVRERRFLINRCDQWIYDETMPYLGQRVLEVGCGLGNLMRHLADRELVVGIDPDLDSIEHLRLLYSGRSNVQTYPLDICDPQVLELKASRFDTIVSLNVFEHIQDDMLALRHVRELLGTGGRLVLIVPAHSWLYGSMDRAIGHCRRYDKQLMTNKLAQTGFVPIVQKYLNALGTLGWFVNGRILRRRVPPSGQLRLFNLVVPFVQAAERRVPPPFGLSLLSIAK